MLTFIRLFFLTGCFISYIPFLRGTFGTLIGFLLFILLHQYSYIYYPLIIFFFLAGVRTCVWGEKYFQEKDSGKIVIDEITGYLITMWGIQTSADFYPFSWAAYKIPIIGFILFRIFDIVKPFQIRQIEKIGQGYGVMLDDILAGVYANICLRIIIDLLLV